MYNGDEIISFKNKVKLMTKITNSNMQIFHNEIHSVFELLGKKENDLSYSVAYVLSKCPNLMKSLINYIEIKFPLKNYQIKLQGFHDERGYTDVEITLNSDYQIIVEAKKSWNLPTTNQLKKYVNRFKGYKKTKRLFLIFSDYDNDSAPETYPSSYRSIPIELISWREIVGLINKTYSRVKNKEKFLLMELKKYLSKVVTMENNESNMVYVVSLSNQNVKGSNLTWIDIVLKKHHYFFSTEGGWPSIPPNYIAFRFKGKLQSIHHVDKYIVTDNLHKYLPEIKLGKKNRYLLYLGQGFEPRKELPNGNIYSNGRYWCMLDTLFTAKTVQDAIHLTKRRKEE